MLKYGYHKKKIKKGKIGKISKLIEEIEEFKDAKKQGSKILQIVELADIYGALESLAIEQGVKMKDLKKFSNITKRAFRNGYR